MSVSEPVHRAVQVAVAMAIAPIKDAVKTIAADLKGVHAQGEQTAAEAASLKKTVGAHATHIEELGEWYAALVARQKSDKLPVPQVCWLLKPDPDVAEAVMDDLKQWLRDVYVYLRELPECWAGHPDIVEDLLALRYAHHDAFVKSSGALKDRLDWLGTYLPAVANRVRDAARCGRDGHPEASDTPAVPMERYASRAARVWAVEKRTPAYTPAEEDEAQRWRNRHSIPDTVPDDLYRG